MEEIGNMRSPNLVLPWRSDGDVMSLLSREWLITNGLGGYASSSLMNVATRRYHGVFVPDLPSPRGRTLMVPRLEEEAEFGVTRVRLSGVEYADGRLDTDVPSYLTEFCREWQTPVWRFAFHGRRLCKRIIMPYGQNSVYVEYRLEAGEPVRLRLRPFVTFRRPDAPLSEARKPPFPLTIVNGRYEVHLCDGVPDLKLCLRPEGGVFVADHTLSMQISYRVDRDRGSPHVENLSSPGYFVIEMEPDRSVAFVASVESWEMLEVGSDAVFSGERDRLQRLMAQWPGEKDEFELLLGLAADQFIVFPGSRLEEQTLAQAGLQTGAETR